MSYNTNNIFDNTPMSRNYITLIFLQFIFIPFGIFLNPAQQKLAKFYTPVFLFVFFTLFIGQVKAYADLNSLLYVLDNTMYVIATLVATIFLFTSIRGKQYFLQFHKKVLSEYSNEEFFTETDNRFRKIALYLGPVIALSFTGVIVYPVLNACFTDVGLGSPSTLIYLSYYPWKVDTVGKYMGTIFLQVCSGSVVCSVVGCMILFILFCIVLLETHCNILKNKIEKINKEIPFYMTSNKKFKKFVFESSQYGDEILRNEISKREEEVYQKLVRIVKYHQFINSFTNDVIKCCSRIVDTSTAAVFSSTILLITMFMMSQGNYIYQLKVMSMSIVTFSLFIIQCYIGEILYHVNIELLSQMYNIEWYKMPLRFRKLLITFMLRCQKTFQIKAFNTLIVNYLFFTTVLKNIYSVLQFILRMQKNQNVM